MLRASCTENFLTGIFEIHFFYGNFASPLASHIRIHIPFQRYRVELTWRKQNALLIGGTACFREEMLKVDECDIEKLGTLASGGTTIAVLGDRWWSQASKRGGGTCPPSAIYGKKRNERSNAGFDN